MAEPEQVTHLHPPPLPDTVPVRRGMTLTPNEMRALRDASGQTLQQLLGGGEGDLDASPDQIQALVWVMLRRLGHTASWDQAGDVAPAYEEQPEPDPTTAAA